MVICSQCSDFHRGCNRKTKSLTAGNALLEQVPNKAVNEIMFELLALGVR